MFFDLLPAFYIVVLVESEIYDILKINDNDINEKKSIKWTNIGSEMWILLWFFARQ